MSTIRPILMALAVVALPAPVALAQDKSAAQAQAAPSRSRRSIRSGRTSCKAHCDEYKAALRHRQEKGRAAVKAFRFDKPLPNAAFSPRFLAVAEREPRRS